MVNWKNPEEIKTEGIAFTKAVYVLFGIYIWEICMTGSFELSIFTGRRKLAWPLIFVFLCRYSVLFAIVGSMISDQASTKIDCGALYTFTCAACNLAILGASTSLMIRAMALWEWKRRAVLSMLCLSLGQWAILIRTMMVVQALWDDQSRNCVVVKSNHVFLSLKYVYTVAFDFVVLGMTIFALRKRFRDEALSSFLFRDGLVYFLIASTCNTIPAILAVLNLNAEMNVVAIIPAATVLAIAACRAVIRLQAFSPSNRENVQNNSSFGDQVSTPPLSHRSPSGLISFLPSYKATEPGAHITAEGITMNEFSSSQWSLDQSGIKYPSHCDGDNHSSYSTVQSVQLPPRVQCSAV